MFKFLEVNGDTPNNSLEKLILLADLIHGFMTESKLHQENEYESPSNKQLNIFVSKKTSPGRIACVGFLNYFLKLKFKSKVINVLDFGCGDGVYCDIIKWNVFVSLCY